MSQIFPIVNMIFLKHNNLMINLQIIFIPRSRLNKFVDQSQLPLELGGNFIYDHDKWIENRRVRILIRIFKN